MNVNLRHTELPWRHIHRATGPIWKERHTMTGTSAARDQQPVRHAGSPTGSPADSPTGSPTGSPADNPAGVPAQRPVALDRLDVLTGLWETEASFAAGSFGPGSPATTNRGGRTTFEWLEGKFFLTQRFVVEHPAAPSGIAIIGAGEEPETFTQHYYDSRGVARVYQPRLLAAVYRGDLRRRCRDRRLMGGVGGRA
jgi:hypothetical protein